MKIKHTLWMGIGALLLFVAPVNGAEIMIRMATGGSVTVDVSPQVRVQEIKKKIEAALNLPADQQILYVNGVSVSKTEYAHALIGQEVWLDCPKPTVWEIAQRTLKQTKLVVRDYQVGLAEEEKSDISYIVKMLAHKPLTKIWRYRKQLELAGDRVEHVHPLRFLMCVFTNDSLIVGIRHIRNRSWIWKDFYNGLRDSLIEEYENENLTQADINDFAGVIGMDADQISSFIHEGLWEEFVDHLITNVERSESTGRYDM